MLEANKNLTISQAGIDLIKEFEGYHTRLADGRCQAYLDKLAKPPVWTIGYGCTEGVYEGLIETHQENIARKKRELAKHERLVKTLVKVPLNQHQFDATVSLSYNVGLNACKTFLRHLNNSDFTKAADAMLLYRFAGGVEYRGLLRRRKKERELFLKEVLTPKEVVNSSTKLTMLKRVRLFFGSIIPGGGFLEWLGYLEPVKNFATENWHFIMLGAVVLFYTLLKWIEFKSVEDSNQGRYTPSSAMEDNIDNDAIDVSPFEERIRAEGEVEESGDHA
jgi:GH24 family phage-related lysozyme (muramidase)